MSANDYVTRVIHDPAALPAADWDALLAASSHPTPFMRHAYLQALHSSRSACADTGWTPHFVTLWDPDAQTLAAACPLYLKSHSYGEYVFDWAWAQAHENHGLPYYPKGVVAVPFTPVPGSRLLARDARARAALLTQLQRQAQLTQLSSLHLLFGAEDDLASCDEAGWMPRSTVQFHFQNSGPHGQPFEDFEALLASFQQDKRKKVRQERRKVAEAGVRFRWRQGRDIGPEDWDFFYRCYERTYWEHGNPPYLQRPFFTRMAEHMPENWLLFIAEQDGRPVASSLIGLDTTQRVAYGRYWGSLARIDCLHFEACYYQPLAWCIAHGYRRFEGGAQGEHKMARALLPVRTASAHWLAHPAFAQAVRRFLEREDHAVGGYLEGLKRHSPLRSRGL